ncbi:MAG: thioredoxin family protein [Gemmatimonadota bacterium]
MISIPTAVSAQAPDKEPFTEQRFEALQEQGAYVLLDVFADWCPTCAAQQKVLAAFQDEHPDAPLHILSIDFDDRKDLVRRFGAPRQSTLILFHGTERVWFSVAETRRDAIFGALAAATR